MVCELFVFISFSLLRLSDWDIGIYGEMDIDIEVDILFGIDKDYLSFTFILLLFRKWSLCRAIGDLQESQEEIKYFIEN